MVVVGDSFAAGVGTGRYDLAGRPCLRSSQAYGPLLATRLDGNLTFLACSGAKMNEVVRKQIPKIPRETDLVLITMGGNDTGFMPVLSVCTLASDDETCRTAVRVGKAAAVTVVPVQLAAAVMLSRRRAPRARIVVVGYPKLFETGRCTAAFVPNQWRRKLLNEGADLLNNALRSASRSLEVGYVDVGRQFVGHGICAPEGKAWINPPGSGPDSYHPTPTGYEQGYLTALSAVR
ncbi:MAG: hypothetical protein QG622_2947 [Actinomycetota bacterium]|nr:hypothetical protein [Actinomycetota bacterium]